MIQKKRAFVHSWLKKIQRFKDSRIQAYCSHRSASAALCERPQRSLRLISPQRAQRSREGRREILYFLFPLRRNGKLLRFQSIKKTLPSSYFTLSQLATHNAQLNSLPLSPRLRVSLSFSPSRVFMCSGVHVFGCSGVHVFGCSGATVR